MSFIDIISDLPTNPANPYKSRPLAGVNTIVVHQTDGSDKGIDSVVSAANYHVNTKGWGGIAYHVFVTDDGKQYLTNKLETKSYHAGGHNTRSVGITITGKHRYDPSKTNEEIIGKKKYDALVSAIVKTMSMLPNSNIEIISHKNVSSSGKTDPNLNMDQLRNDVKKKKSSPAVMDSAGAGDNSDSSFDVENIEAIKLHLDTIKHHVMEIEKLI